jgi:hypothetical protein
MPACHSALQPWVSLGLLYNQSPLLSIPYILFPFFHLHLLQITLIVVPYPLLGPFPICSAYPMLVVRFLNKITFYRMGLLAPCPTPILEDQGVSLGLDSTLTLPAWVALLVVKLPPALLSRSQSRTSPPTTKRCRRLWGSLWKWSMSIGSNVAVDDDGDGTSRINVE